MNALSDYVHDSGMKLGIYTDRGELTCAGRPASRGYENVDALTFARWGIDYLKQDSCNATAEHEAAFAEYSQMRDALNASGRAIYFSLCGWNDWCVGRSAQTASAIDRSIDRGHRPSGRAAR